MTNGRITGMRLTMAMGVLALTQLAPPIAQAATVSVSASAGNVTAETEKQRKADHEKQLAAIDLDVSIPRSLITDEQKKRLSNSFKILPDGVLCCYVNGWGLTYWSRLPPPEDSEAYKLRREFERKGLHNLKMGFVKTGGISWSDSVDLAFKDPGFQKGFVILYGETAWRALLDTRNKGDNRNGGVPNLERWHLNTLAEMATGGFPYTESQLDSFRVAFKRLREKNMALYDIYKRFRKTKVNDDQARQIFQVFVDAQAAYGEAKHVIERAKTADQRRYKTRRQFAGPGTASSSSGPGLAVSLRAAKGKFSLNMNFERQKARTVLKEFLKVCDESIGELVVCSLEPSLSAAKISGAVRCHSIQEGLDQIAKLVKGKLEKQGTSWVISVNGNFKGITSADIETARKELATTIEDGLALLKEANGLKKFTDRFLSPERKATHAILGDRPSIVFFRCYRPLLP